VSGWYGRVHSRGNASDCLKQGKYFFKPSYQSNPNTLTIAQRVSYPVGVVAVKMIVFIDFSCCRPKLSLTSFIFTKNKVNKCKVFFSGLARVLQLLLTLARHSVKKLLE
jgi:hypothetical protein